MKDTIRELSDRLLAEFRNWTTEEEVRFGWIRALSDHTGLEFELERDRNDAYTNKVVLEFKAPGLFNGSTESPAFQQAVLDRLRKYIERRAVSDNGDPKDYVGIAIDGAHLAFARFAEDEITHGFLMPVEASSLKMVVATCVESKRRAFNGDNVVSDFGHQSLVGAQLMTALSDSLKQELHEDENVKVRMLYEEWRAFFGQASDLTRLQEEAIRKGLSFVFDSDSHQLSESLFVIHTYNTLVIKLVAAHLLSRIGLTSIPDFAEYMSTLPDRDLLGQLFALVESGRLYREAGILNFVEEVLFSWYVDAAKSPANSKRIVDGIRRILVMVSLYEFDDLESARTHDVLKLLYQNLVPRTLRKALGEFYTPDWLVEHSYSLAEPIDWTTVRVLDPTCGSGSFVIKAIRFKRKALQKHQASELLKSILQDVCGFDLSPLAVQTARINYLIAISDLLKQCPGEEIEIPILFADAVYSPANDRETEAEERTVHYRIGSVHSDLKISLPSSVAFDRKKTDDLFWILAENVAENREPEELVARLRKTRYQQEANDARWRDAVASTYENVLDLHRQDWNGIWFRVIKNFFWSAAMQPFDLVIGNPPWVRWSHLPLHYRERIKPTCQQYDIFSHTPRHGGNELDISGMITYTVADKWLKNGGQLVFLLTQTHFQSPSSYGFRKFRITDGAFFEVVQVDDFSSIQPFSDATNKTSVALMKKGTRGTEYPVKYRIFSCKPGVPKRLAEDLSYKQVMDLLASSWMEASEVGDKGSPWAILPSGVFSRLSSIRGTSSNFAGRKGVTTDLNGVYFVELLDANKNAGLVKVRIRPEAGKTDIGPERTFWLEPDLIYPLIKGASDFDEYRLKTKNENLFAIVPNKGITSDKLDEASLLLETNFRRTKAMLSEYKGLLLNRSTYRKRLPNAPFFAIYNVGEYTFAPWKVIWAEQRSSFKAAVAASSVVPIIGERPYIPDHKVFFVEFQESQPAMFLCALLNNPTIRGFVDSHVVIIPPFVQAITWHRPGCWLFGSPAE